jgi:ArsR family transcriptional regulator, arsenate/arsenite/antimonite-responsive transcriptional repressor
MTDHVHVDAAEALECCGTVVEAPLSEADAEGLAAMYAALADPVRLRLLSLVAAQGELCSCDLQGPLGKSQPTVSHHTKVLAEVGLLEGDKRGRWVHWRVPAERRALVRQVVGTPGAPVPA